MEEGFHCENSVSYPASVQLRVTYRDFKARQATGGHPDFERGSINADRMPGPVCTTANSTPCTTAGGVACPAGTCGALGSDGAPVFHLGSGTAHVQSPESFALWYRGTHPSYTIDSFTDSLTLTRQGTSDVYRYDSSAHFPLGDLNRSPSIPLRGSGATCPEIDSDGPTGSQGPQCCNDTNVYMGLNGEGQAIYGTATCQGRNYHFTTELRYFFQYKGGEILTFRGDDDVWVFVNGRLAVDIGGVHGARDGRVILGDDGDGDAEDSNCTVNGTSMSTCSLEEGEIAGLADDKRFGLQAGGVYEISLFHAERQTTSSNFRLTLAGFLAPRTYCEPVCGDGLVTGWEVCDSGAQNQNGTYGVCNEECSESLYCGDAVVQGPSSTPPGPEQCDDGVNLDTYRANASVTNRCAANCQYPPYCGDGTVQGFVEDCDLGASGNDGSYNGCTTSCTWGPYCGDGVKNGTTEHPEECDDAGDNVPYWPNAADQKCGLDCQPAPHCGDGVRNGPEECDLGAADNTGAYGGCTATCKLAPRCGDGKVQKAEGEECDAGPLGSLGCSPQCKVRAQVPR